MSRRPRRNWCGADTQQVRDLAGLMSDVAPTFEVGVRHKVRSGEIVCCRFAYSRKAFDSVPIIVSVGNPPP